MKKMIRLSKKKKVLLILIVLISIIVWLIWGNTTVKVSHYEIEDKNLPDVFDGFKILQISDFHNSEFKDENKLLLDKIDRENPDIIAITGDMLYYYEPKNYLAKNFIKMIGKKYPCYYITGNHEARMPKDYEDFEKTLKKNNVKILRNKKEEISINKENIQILGIDDPKFIQEGNSLKTEFRIISKSIDEIDKTKGYKILLSHRPEAFD